MKTYRDLADFIERLLNDKLTSPYEIDGFESVTLATKPGQKYWPIECWRRQIIDVAAIQRPHLEGHWAHPESFPYLEKIKDVLMYLDAQSGDEYSSLIKGDQAAGNFSDSLIKFSSLIESGEEGRLLVLEIANREGPLTDHPEVKAARRALKENRLKQDSESRKWESARSWIAIAVALGALIVAYLKP